MTDATPSNDYDSLPLSVTRQIDSVCDDFESLLEAGGETPKLSPFIDRVEPVGRPQLLKELVSLAMEHLKKQCVSDPADELRRVNADLDEELETLLDSDAATATHMLDGDERIAGKGLHVHALTATIQLN